MRGWRGWAVVAVVLLAGCGVAQPVLQVTGLQRVAQGCASTDCGPYSATLSWGPLGFPATTGYLVSLNGVQVADVAASPYRFVGLDCATTFALSVQPHNAGGATGATFTSTYTSPPCAAAPANTAEPVVTGTVATGAALSTTNGTWTGSPTFTYQWQDCAADGTSCSDIGGATSSTYTVASGDAGHTIQAVVTAANAGGSASAAAPIVPAVDEFSGSSVDANVWRVMNQQGDTSGNEEECYLAGHTTEGSGDLTEQLDFNSGGFVCPAGTPSDAGCTGACATVNGGGTAHWESGAVQMKAVSFLYGTIKVSAKLAPQTGHAFPAIWMLGNSCQTSSTSPLTWLSGTSGTATGFFCPWSSDASNAAEIDIIEANAGNDTSYTMTEWNGGSVAHCTSGTISNYSTNFHTYELDWSVGSLTWKVDGTTECTSTTSVPSHPMFLIINTAESGTATSGGGNTVVDFAHVSH